MVVINDFLLGYVEGAQHADANVKVATAYIGDFVNSPKAKELTQVQMTQGADVLHQVAGAAGLGLFEACAERPASGRSASTPTSESTSPSLTKRWPMSSSPPCSSATTSLSSTF